MAATGGRARAPAAGAVAPLDSADAARLATDLAAERAARVAGEAAAGAALAAAVRQLNDRAAAAEAEAQRLNDRAAAAQAAAAAAAAGTEAEAQRLRGLLEAEAKKRDQDLDDLAQEAEERIEKVAGAVLTAATAAGTAAEITRCVEYWCGRGRAWVQATFAAHGHNTSSPTSLF